MRSLGRVLEFHPPVVDPVLAKCDVDPAADRVVGRSATVTAPVHPQSNDSVDGLENFDLTSMGVDVGADLVECELDHAVDRRDIDVDAEAVRGQQLPDDGVERGLFEEDLAPPLANHLDEPSEALPMEDVQPVEQLLDLSLDGWVVSLEEPARQLRDVIEDLAVAELAIAHECSSTSARTISKTLPTACSTGSEKPQPKSRSAGSTSMIKVSSVITSQ